MSKKLGKDLKRVEISEASQWKKKHKYGGRLKLGRSTCRDVSMPVLASNRPLI